MDRKWLMRALSALLCMVLLCADLPAGMLRAGAETGERLPSEERFDSAAAEVDPGETEAQAEDPMAEAPQQGDAEVPTVAEAEPPVPEDIPDEAQGPDSGEASEAAEVEEQALPSERPREEAETDGTDPLPADAGEDGDAALSALVGEWVGELAEQGPADDCARALWLYERLIAELERGEAEDALAALSERSAAPLGYARAYAALLRAAGIESRVVEGGGAAWDLAKLDGAWVHIDAWADDVLDGYGTHFGLNDAAMARDHAWEAELPACTDPGKNYLVRERGYCAFTDREELRALLSDALDAGADRLLLFNAGAEASVEAPLVELLGEIDPSVEAEVSEKGCYAAVRLSNIAASAPAAERAAGEISFTKEAAEGCAYVAIGVGESMVASAAGATSASWRIAEGDGDFAKVNRTSGKVTGKRASSRPVTLVAEVGGREIEAQFYVVTQVTKLAFAGNLKKLTLGVGERFAPGCVVTGYAPAAGVEGVAPKLDDGKVYSYSCKPASVARVDGRTGEITALRAGTATVTLKAYNAAKGDSKRIKTLTVTVKPGLGEDGFALAPEAAKLARGDELRIQADLKGGYAHLIWPDEAELAEAGLTIEPSADGGEVVIRASESARAGASVPITARTDRYAEERSATAQLAIIEPYAPGDLAFEPPVKAVLGEGEQLALELKPCVGADGAERGGSVRWSATDSAKVSAAGNVKAKSLGGKSGATATVTATAFNSAGAGAKKIAATQEFKVIPAPTKLSCNKSSKPTVYLGVGERRTLTIAVGGYAGGVTTGNFYDPTVGNTRPEVVTVDDSELCGGNRLTLTGARQGSSKVSVKTYNGKSVTLTVRVLPRPERIELPEALWITAGEKLRLNVSLLSPDGSGAYAELRWPEELVWSENGEPSGIAIVPEDNDAVILKAPKRFSADELGRSVTLVVSADGYADGAEPLEAAVCTITAAQAPVGGKGGNMLLALDSDKLGKGETARATFRFAEEAKIPDALAEVAVSGTKSVVSVSAIPDSPGEYEIVAKAPGKAVITAKAKCNGEKVTARLTVCEAPKGLTLQVDGEKNPASLAMGVGERLPIEATLSPSGSAGRISYRFEPEGIAEIQPDKEGAQALVALANGETKLTVSTYNGKGTKSLRVTVKNMPRELRIDEKLLDEGKLILGVGAKVNLGAKLDEGSAGKIRYEVTKFTPANAKHKLNDLLSIDGDGNLSAKACCTAKLKISTYEAAGVPPVKLTLEIRKAPTAIAFDESFGNYAVRMEEGEALDLRPHLSFTPTDSAATLTYELTYAKGEAEEAHIRIEDGVVTPLSPGKNTVRVTAHNGVRAEATVWVLTEAELDLAKDIRFKSDPPEYLDVGGSYKPKLYVFPAGAETKMSWSVSDEAIVSVSKKTGEIKQLSFGHVRLTGVDERSGLTLKSEKIAVSSEECCQRMPSHRTTSKDKISTILNQIAAVKKAALTALDRSKAGSKSARKAAINRAFEMYQFAWTPTAKVPYWRAANSEGGHKDFKVGTYYFGMPYSQNNRVNASLNGYTTASTDGYSYRKTTSAFNGRGRDYPGSDCSSFASMAVWGYGSSHRADVTLSIARANYYTTVDWSALKPGDLICKGGSHVVMFLYFTNAAKTQFAVIEQGGGGTDAYSNCVATAIHNISYYRDSGYAPRRPNF